MKLYRGNNIGPQREQWMKEHLRLEPIEITEEEWLIDYVDYVYELISYIALLGKELDGTASLAHIHGWRSGRVEEGEEARARLDKLSKSLLLPPFTEELSKLKGDGE